MTKKIVVTPRSFGQFDASIVTSLADQGYQAVLNPHVRPLSETELCDMTQDAVGLIVGVDPCSAHVIDHAEGLRVISKYGVGIDNIDVAAATRRRIPVTITSGTNDEAVADHTFGLLLAVARRTSLADRSLRRRQWEKFVGAAVAGKCLGVVGTGRIGKGVVRRGLGFGMKVLCCDIEPDPHLKEQDGVDYVDLSELIRSADFLTLHLPLSRETEGIIGRDELGQMKTTAFLINTARGELVGTDALIGALRSGRIAGAALDVFTQEPLGDSPLVKLDNVVLTPHIGSYTKEAVSRMASVAVENLLAVLEGRLPEHTVNAQDLYSDTNQLRGRESL